MVAEKPHKKKNKFLGTEVPRNFSDQCSLDFAYFLCLFSGRRAKSSQELCSWELFFLILGGFSPSSPANFAESDFSDFTLGKVTQRALRDILMPRGKN